MLYNVPSLRSNLIANYASQLYTAGVGILILPLYIKFMGAEAYGLVGFFTVLQAWFALLDLGLTPSVGRETARFFGGSISALAYRQLYRALNVIYLIIAFVGGGALFIFAEPLAYKWFKVETLSMDEVVLAVQVMAFCVALRWLSGLYRGVVTGAEQLVWLSGFNAVISTLRFIAVFVTMYFYGFTPFIFFSHQLVVALLEQIGLWWKSRKLIPSKKQCNGVIGWSFRPVKSVLKFSLTIAFTSSMWVLVTQTDKLILSGVLPLAEYGYFTLAVLVASGIMILSGPISNVVMPRMARLHAEGKHIEVINLYRHATQLVCVAAGSAGIYIAFFAEPLLYAWTSDKVIASEVAPVLKLYALGNSILAVSAFPYYLQYALGNLRYHLIGNAVIAVALIPTIIFAASHFGGVGAGWAWLIINSIYLIAWVGYVHSKIKPGLHLSWVFNDVIRICFSAFIVLIPFVYSLSIVESRGLELAIMATAGLLALGASALSARAVRLQLKNIGVLDANRR